MSEFVYSVTCSPVLFGESRRGAAGFFFPVCCGFNQDFKIFLTRISNGLLIETVLVTACVFKWW